ncbi:MAG: hypothetical protein RMI90_15315, partial [Thermoguttaceae bacterium]|nr:hypothetical protein [Thermoguttaceae bacterium]
RQYRQNKPNPQKANFAQNLLILLLTSRYPHLNSFQQLIAPAIWNPELVAFEDASGRAGSKALAIIYVPQLF